MTERSGEALGVEGDREVLLQMIATARSAQSLLASQADPDGDRRWSPEPPGGRAVMVARVGWILAYPPTLGLLIVSMVAQLSVATASDTAPGGPLLPGRDALGVSLLLLETLVLGQYVVNTLVIALRRHRDWMGLFTSIDGLLFLVFVFPAVDALIVTEPEWARVAEAWQWIGAAAQVPFLLFFPDGRLVPRRSAILALGWPAIWAASTYLLPGGSGLLTVPTARLALWLGFVAACLATQLYRFRTTASHVQRQQTKWLVASLWVAFIGIVFVLPVRFVADADLPLLFQHEIALPVLLIAADCLGVAFTMAILRYRLWDIDVVVRRTVTYGALVVTLGAVYAGAVLALQTVLGHMVTTSDPLAVAASTLFTAALFNPARHGLRQAVDRRFNRTHHDATRTVATFGQRLRAQVNIDALLTDLVTVAVGTAQPAHASVWMRVEPRSRRGSGAQSSL